MDRAHQGIGSGSYLDADRVDRLVDQLVRTLNGSLYASALAPGFKVPNSYFKENGAPVLVRALHAVTAVGVLGLAPAVAALLAIVLLNAGAARLTISGYKITYGGTDKWQSQKYEFEPGAFVLLTVDGPSTASGQLVYATALAGARSVTAFAMEHVT